ncbi:MAG: tetratricopeptide repeat protein [Clostridiales bacterium]|nr:tetratricopeptide repeat protein [Clostridiales bacterium]
MSDKSRVLNFFQGAEFHYNKYEKAYETGKLPDALVSLRKAVELEPENTEYLMELCELYSDMECFDISNALIFSLMQKTDAYSAECMYLIGYNAMGLNNIEDAKSFFNKYLHDFDDDEFLDEVNGYLDLMDQGELFDDYGIDAAAAEKGEEIPEDVLKLADEGKDALDGGDPERAITLLKDIAEEYPHIIYARNNLSLAYYIAGRYYEAYKENQKIVKDFPNNIHARCNGVIFANSLHNEELLKKALNEMQKLEANNIDELLKITLTYCELGMHEKANIAVSTLLEETPYDLRAMYIYAASLANLGKDEEAKNVFRDILKIDPDDLISAHYLRYLNSHEFGKREDISYIYALPRLEALNCFSYLNDCVTLPEEEQRERWNQDEKFRSILKWILNTLGDTVTKATAINLIGIYGGKIAEDILRGFAVKHNESDELKDCAIYRLIQMQAKPPFITYIDGRLREVDVPNYYPFDENDPQSFKIMMMHILHFFQTMKEPEKLRIAYELAAKYRDKLTFKEVSTPKLYACALICLTYDSLHLEMPWETVIKGAELIPEDLERCIAEIQGVLTT